MTEESWDGWLYHRYFSCIAADAIAAGAAASEALQVSSTGAAIHIEVDSKAMRKLEIHTTLFAVLEVAEIGTCSMSWVFNSRSLVKLA